jgi:hypothetical protein
MLPVRAYAIPHGTSHAQPVWPWPDTPRSQRDRSRAQQKVPAELRAVLYHEPFDPFRPVVARLRAVVASNLPVLGICGGNLRLSFRAAPATSRHSTMAWDKDSLSARYGDASKPLQSLVDTRRALQSSEFLAKPSSALQDPEKPSLSRLRARVSKTRLEQRSFS